jgi:hypothetical protein
MDTIISFVGFQYIALSSSASFARMELMKIILLLLLFPSYVPKHYYMPFHVQDTNLRFIVYYKLGQLSRYR